MLREEPVCKSWGVGAKERSQNSFTLLSPLKDLKGCGVALPRMSSLAFPQTAVQLFPLL